jgi:hypothetical protein
LTYSGILLLYGDDLTEHPISNAQSPISIGIEFREMDIGYSMWYIGYSESKVKEFKSDR